MPGSKVVECVPNFSEGRDKRVIESISAAIRGSSGVSLLDVDPGADTNRTVYTFSGPPEEVLAAALAAARTAQGLIDMAKHSGAHPRMGALDVCPFVPVAGVTMEECVELSRRFGEALAASLSVPVYLYEKAATRPERQSLAEIRKGEYEALSEKLKDPHWKPDFGPASFVPRWGATVTGAREFLIAYNINLNTRDQKLANEVALTIREGGRAARDADGQIIKDAEGRSVKVPGLLKDVRAIGWYIEAYRCAQISVNLINYKTTSLHTLFETAKAEAEKLGLVVTGSELVGLVPLEPLVAAGRHFLKKAGKSEGAPEAELIEMAVRSMGLDSVAAFEPEKKIVEYAAAKAAGAAGRLAGMAVDEFIDEVSSDSPAPGGGSVAALAGALGAALLAMAANLSVGKKGYEQNWQAMSELAVKAQELKKRLVAAIDEDTAAFDAVMAAMKLPKSSDEEKRLRSEKMAQASKRAAMVPLCTAQTCLDALGLAAEVAAKGNVNSVSDAGVGALAARAGVEGALLNVRINLGGIEDAAFTTELKSRAAQIAQQAAALENAALNIVREKIGA